jgi:hypothetical protein
MSQKTIYGISLILPLVALFPAAQNIQAAITRIGAQFGFKGDTKMSVHQYLELETDKPLSEDEQAALRASIEGTVSGLSVKIHEQEPPTGATVPGPRRQHPAVPRIVLYHQDQGDGTYRSVPAIIERVWSEDCVNLRVMGERPEFKTSVLRGPEEATDGNPFAEVGRTVGTWNFPDYSVEETGQPQPHPDTLKPIEPTTGTGSMLAEASQTGGDDKTPADNVPDQAPSTTAAPEKEVPQALADGNERQPA